MPENPVSLITLPAKIAPQQAVTISMRLKWLGIFAGPDQIERVWGIFCEELGHGSDEDDGA